MATTFLENFNVSHFSIFIKLKSDLYLPGYKGSAFRGGFGYAFKSIACPTHDADCIHKRLGNPCIYSQVFETPVPPDSLVMRKYPYAPHPFVLTPPSDGRVYFTPGERLRLGLVLVGRSVQWLAYFICTLEELGRRGVGPRRGNYQIERVESAISADSNEIGSGAEIYDGHLRKVIGVPHTFKGLDFIEGEKRARKASLAFETPARVVSGERLATDLPFSTLIRSLLRRLALLTYFHCEQATDAQELRDLIAESDGVRVNSSSLHWQDWKRYSTRQQAQMKLGGLVGTVDYEGDLTPFVPFLRVGELAHIGKATSFGLGKYNLHLE